MYAGGHLLTSALTGTALWPRTGLSFPKTIGLLLAANIIDFDHLLRYQLDDGTANSLTLHWLHVNAAVIFLLIFGFAIWLPRYRQWLMVAGTGLALHFSMDALAYSFNYNMLWLGITDLILLVVLSVVTLRKNLPAHQRKLLLFYYGSWLVMTGIQAGLHFWGQFKPDQNGWIYAVAPAMLLLSAFLFVCLFDDTTAEKQTLPNQPNDH